MGQRSKEWHLPIVANPSPAEFERISKQSRIPVLITDAMTDWPAMQNWTLDYISERSGELKVPVEYYPSGDRYENFEAIAITMREYVRHLRDGKEKNYYVAARDIKEICPAIIEEAPSPRFLQTADIQSRETARALFAGLETMSPMHYHQLDQAVLCQIVGSKRLLLYPPAKTRDVKPHPWYSRSNYSRIAHTGPHDMWEAFATHARSRPAIDITLEPGQMLFIPIHWWHVVGGFDECISLTFFWRAPLREWFFPTPGWKVVARKLSQKPVGHAVAFAKKMGLHHLVPRPTSP